jgi:hypothetical protein
MNDLGLSAWARLRPIPETHQWAPDLNFHVFPLSAPPSGRGGVYVFAKRLPPGGMLTLGRPLWLALYVGKTDDYADRVCGTHHRIEAAVAQGATHLHVYDIAEPYRGRLEEHLIRHLNPALNDLLRPRGLLERMMLEP